MPSSADALLGLELQAAGENLATWGDPKLNQVINGMAQSIAGMVEFSLSGTKALTSTNYVENEARKMILNITGGTGGTVNVPARSKVYLVSNGAAGAVSITTGGAAAVVQSGQSAFVWCDGIACRTVLVRDFSGQRATSVGAPLVASDAATKKYVDDTAFSMAAGSLPAQTGATGFLTPNLSAPGVAGWRALDSTDFEAVRATVSGVRAGTSNDTYITPSVLVDADAYVNVTANGAFTLDFSAGRKFRVTMTGNSTMSITGLTKEISGVIRFQQDATGGRTLTLNAAIKKFGLYTLSTAPNAVDRCGVEICNGVAELTALEKGLA